MRANRTDRQRGRARPQRSTTGLQACSKVDSRYGDQATCKVLLNNLILKRRHNSERAYSQSNLAISGRTLLAIPGASDCFGHIVQAPRNFLLSAVSIGEQWWKTWIGLPMEAPPRPIEEDADGRIGRLWL